MPYCTSDSLKYQRNQLVVLIVGSERFKETGFGGRQCFGEARLTPIQNAPPKSLRATQGQGSLEWSMTDMWKEETLEG